MRASGRVRPVDAVRFARDVAFPVLAAALAVAYADIRIPMGLPGHRGLVWLTLLAAVALVTCRRETVIAVGAACTLATMAAGATGPLGSGRYLAAAVLLYAVTGLPGLRHRRWPVALAAAPIHLVVLVGAVTFSTEMVEKVLFHMGFGLVAGLLGWAIAFAMDCCSSAGKEYLS